MSSMETNVATQKRLGAYSGGKATYASIGSNIFGNFQPLDPSQSLQAIGIMGQGYQFITTGDQDIKVNDILTVNAVDYTVKGVRRQTNGSIDSLECVCVLTI